LALVRKIRTFSLRVGDPSAVEGPLTIDNEKSITDENMRKRFEPSILMVGH